MDLGRDVKRLLGRQRGAIQLKSELWTDPSALELLPLRALRREAAAAGLAAHRASRRERGPRLAGYALMLREVARRTGETQAVEHAASAAGLAVRDAEGAGILAARLEQVATARLAAALCGDKAAADLAAASLKIAEGLNAAAIGEVLRRDALRAEADAGEALAAGDLDRAVEAAGRLDSALERIQRTGTGEAEALALRRQRADFLIGFGVRLKDRALLAQALDDLTIVAKGVDPDYRPLSWARVEGLRASALAALGDLTGEPNRLAEAVRVYAAAAEHIDFDHSPLDRARLSHGLALALQSLAEAIEDEGLYDHALAAYDQALSVLEAGKAPVLRASVVHDRAACVARRAERTGDAAALARAEESFREEIARQDAAADPVAWAVAQLSLARVYIAQAGLLGAPEPPAGAALALTEAVEVFAERGLKALVEAAQDALERLKNAKV